MELSEQKPVGLTGRYISALFELCSENNKKSCFRFGKYAELD